MHDGIASHHNGPTSLIIIAHNYTHSNELRISTRQKTKIVSRK